MVYHGILGIPQKFPHKCSDELTCRVAREFLMLYELVMWVENCPKKALFKLLEIVLFEFLR